MNRDIAAEAVRTGDPDRYFASLGAPAELRRGLYALYFFNIEVARAPWSSQDSGIAAIRIEWWREAIDRIYAGEQPPAHPATAELARVIQGAGLPSAAFQRIVTARRQNLAGARQPDRESFSSYIDATSADLMWLAARLLGTPAAAEMVVRDFAWGAGAASFLRAAGELKRRGRFTFVMTDDDLRWAVSEAERRVRSARLRRLEVPRQALPAMLTGWRADATLKRAKSSVGAILSGDLSESEFARRGSLLVRSLSGRW